MSPSGEPRSRASDVLRTIADPAEIQQAAMRLLGEHLGLSRAMYFHVEHDGDGWAHVIETVWEREPGQLNLIGRHSLKGCGSWLGVRETKGRSGCSSGGAVPSVFDLT